MPLFFSFLYLLMNIVASLPKDHKFYVSTTTLDFKEASASIQITSQFFIDDIEMLLREFHEEIQLAPDSDKTKVDVLFEGVLKQYFRIQIDNQDQDFNFLQSLAQLCLRWRLSQINRKSKKLLKACLV